MAPSDEVLLRARIAIPEHVVRRALAQETVALNLSTGQYHGLNPSAAAMLDALEAGESAEDVAARIARDAGQPPARVLADLTALLRSLLARDLIEVHVRDAG